MRLSARQRKNLALGVAFLVPNVLGFLTFTLFPLLFSLVLAFSNWDLRLHNVFKDAPLAFVGLANFARLLSEPDFWRFLRNTLFLMMGIPFSIAGSLSAALMLNRDLRGGSRQTWLRLLAGAVLVCSLALLTLVGLRTSGMTLLFGGLACAVLLGGVLGGTTVYRTLFYTPHFTAGVATFILWKKLYSPHTGPVNAVLQPLLDALAELVVRIPADVVQGVTWLCVGACACVAARGLSWVRRSWCEGATGSAPAVAMVIAVLLPLALGVLWAPAPDVSLLSAVLLGGVVSESAYRLSQAPHRHRCPCGKGGGTVFVLGVGLLVVQLVLIGVGSAIHRLPVMASDGLNAPEWLTQYAWAKPSIMIMGFWAAIGSNNMLLYLAGLSHVPHELHEAAEIDGASPRQRFWHITWPQLAPVTFFIVVMSTIGGLQGGFEMARTMTQGGPAGSTTTLSYFVYTEGFETGRLGYASAVAWALFALVFAVTLFNWKFGNRYVND